MDDRQTNHARNLIAVAIQFVERLELLRLQIRADALDHFVKILMRDLVALHSVVKRRPQLVFAVLAPERTIEIAPPTFDAFARCTLALADVVAVTHEGIDGAHGVALLPRKQQEGIVEIAGARSGNVLTEGIRRLQVYSVFHRLPTRSCTRSNLEMLGRRANTL